MWEQFWSAADVERYSKRTDTKFCRVPLSAVTEDRGLGNPFLVKLLTILPEGCFIAGGCMANLLGEREDIKDIDMFFRDNQSLEGMIELVNEGFDGEWCHGEAVYKTTYDPEIGGYNPRCINFTCDGFPTIQMINTMRYGSPEAVIDTFDFTISMVATDGTDLVFHPLAPLDIARKRLVLHRMTFSASTIGRLAKYAKRGYYACPGSLLAISQAIRDTEANGDEYQYVD